jgi:hypothetical protein
LIGQESTTAPAGHSSPDMPEPMDMPPEFNAAKIKRPVRLFGDLLGARKINVEFLDPCGTSI